MTNRPLILPPLRRTAKDAEAFARVVHEGQFDKAGRPYIEHLERVAARAETLIADHFEHRMVRWDAAIQVAWLHDMLEPDKRPFGPVTADRLREEGFSELVVSNVIALGSAPSDRSYVEKIEWLLMLIREQLHVILVKIADVEDNSDPERLALLDEPTRERLKKKYGAALPILKHAAARLGWRKGNG